MEFENMKKIWDAQNEEPLYAFDEEAMRRNIETKKKKATRRNNIYGFVLIVIFIITAILWIFEVIINKVSNIYQYLFIAVLLLNVGIVWMGRVRRKEKEQNFGRTMLGDLDHAINSVTYLIDHTKIMRWTLVLPSVILIFLDMWRIDASFWVWVAVPSLLVLSVLRARWEYTRCRKPRKQKLEALRDKLTEETEAEPL